ncbi:MAG: DUF1512 domain-containing protein [Thermoproteus sp. AZ2]|uniref:DUF1512 domain-containing protein n=1 Tax=Thermoproteus sp. AZ2 TaxID=1609232 RepID=A0ACC6V2G9_9CREN
MILQAVPTSTNSALYWILSIIVWFGIIYLFQEVYYMQRPLWQIGGFLSYLGQMIRNAANDISTHMERLKKPDVQKKDVEDVIRRMMDFVVISPTNLDPYGIVPKYKNILNAYESASNSEVAKVLGDNTVAVKNFSTALEALSQINLLYKIIDHYYRIAKKYKLYAYALQISMFIPLLKEASDALNGAVTAFIKGIPVGDGAGPLVAYNVIRACAQPVAHEAVKDTAVVECDLEGRKLYVVKAMGPGSTVGRPDEGVEYIFEKLGVRPKYLITVDAALKLEGEKTGEIAEGVGVAMGGIGAEKFNIESIATKYGVPLYAFLVKMRDSEAITPMTKEIYEAVQAATSRVLAFIREKISPGESAILIGVGNTVGVAQ